MNLKFHCFRTAIRFLHVRFMNNIQQQSNNIWTFCKECNTELQDKPSLSSYSSSERIKNNEASLSDDTANNDA
ncbi:unnamed protein product, partial [Rotaria sp. Silwood1]